MHLPQEKFPLVAGIFVTALFSLAKIDGYHQFDFTDKIKLLQRLQLWATV